MRYSGGVQGRVPENEGWHRGASPSCTFVVRVSSVSQQGAGSEIDQSYFPVENIDDNVLVLEDRA